MIGEFRGEYYFLSNFYEAPVTYGGITYKNNEACFQSMKSKNYNERLSFANLNPLEANAKGRKVSLRSDWEYVKTSFMYDICEAKFIQNETLKQKLLETNGKYLQEGNNWGDTFWGVVNGKGKNELGKILMQIREELK